MTEPMDQRAPDPQEGSDPIDDAAQDWFVRMRTGTPTGEDRTRFAAWRAADPRHGAAYDELTALWADMDGLRHAFAPPPSPAPFQRPRTSARPWLWGSLIAASIALTAMMAPGIVTRLQADHRTGVGEQARIDLPDGSVAWLNTDTALALAYTEARRHIALLHGEALFEVAEDPGRPFAVLAHAGRSTALGTVFAVRSDAGGAMVTVSEGTVAVASPVTERGPQRGAAGTGAEAVLMPAEQVRYASGTPPGPVRRVDPATIAPWRDGFIAIRNRPFAAALAEIDRYRPGRILLMADADSLDPVTARLSIAAIDDGLEALAALNGLTVTMVTPYIVILR